jgi:hypothetical protein
MLRICSQSEDRKTSRRQFIAAPPANGKNPRGNPVARKKHLSSFAVDKMS